MVKVLVLKKELVLLEVLQVKKVLCVGIRVRDQVQDDLSNKSLRGGHAKVPQQL